MYWHLLEQSLSAEESLGVTLTVLKLRQVEPSRLEDFWFIIDLDIEVLPLLHGVEVGHDSLKTLHLLMRFLPNLFE